MHTSVYPSTHTPDVTNVTSTTLLARSLLLAEIYITYKEEEGYQLYFLNFHLIEISNNFGQPWKKPPQFARIVTAPMVA